MPNHCSQQVHIHGQRFLVETIYNALTDNGHNPYNDGNLLNPQFCQLIVPMPFETWIAPKTREQNAYEIDGWYSWRLTNWGTKWDVCDVEIADPITYHGTDKKPSWTTPSDKEVASFTFHCWTAWAPPIPVWDKLVEMGLSVDASYQDEGMMFEGEYLNGKNNSWEPEIEEEEDA